MRKTWQNDPLEFAAKFQKIYISLNYKEDIIITNSQYSFGFRIICVR